MNGGKPGELEPGINGGDFPAPIPWLASVGKVRPLDVAEPSASASPAFRTEAVALPDAPRERRI